ncbi:MAG: RagB/SusD family nutrient uptake outer membrane protein [Bacteroidota bacterium]
MKSKLPLLLLLLLPATVLLTCRKTHVDKKIPVDSLLQKTPHTKDGVNSLLVTAYGYLDGVGFNQPYPAWDTGTDNWVLGSVAGGDACKGSVPDAQDQFGTFEAYLLDGNNGVLAHKWDVNIQALKAANAVIKLIPLITDGSLSTSEKTQAIAEARFLRGFYELEMAKLWRNVPYIDEHVASDDYYKVANPGPIWDKIESDMEAAKNVLPATQPAPGRPNKYAAEAFLVKALLFDHKYSEAKPLLDDLTANGVTSTGAKYTLVHYADNFNPSVKPNAESVFMVPATINDGSGGLNGNPGDAMNFPPKGPATCCGNFQPSYSFVNAFKTDANGLPMPATYNNDDVKNDKTLKPADPFVPTTVKLDARLDWSAGRRGIPYLDWGIMTGADWVANPDYGGPYVNIKSVYYQAAQAATSEAYGGWAANQSTTNGYNAVRYADVLLWAAEVEVEVGSLQKAEDYVNQVRRRAADVTGWVHTYADPSKPAGGYTNVPAANYKVGLYGAAGANAATGFAAGGQAYARKAVYFERMLELGMEGHRYFDLQRWDSRFGGPAGSGFMANLLNAYVQHEGAERTGPSFYHGGVFQANKHEIYPIAQVIIDKSEGKLKQNPGY